MRISFVCVVLCCLTVEILSAEEHRPKKKDDRGKRNLEYQIAHPYSNYQPERRISTGPQGSYPPQYYPRPYRKGRPQTYPIPPYAVQMEPLIHYSQRDPLYDTNILSLDSHNDDLLTENNHITQEEAERRGIIHIHRPPKIIEKPVYIKDPEPIIEIIIKESNVSLPAPPPPPPPPKKKKEQVQVFFVKYKKNPYGTGKDAIVYDKPIPAISPKLPEDEEEEIVQESPYHNYHPEEFSGPPPPSTTLRTIIRPDSETYESPSGVKVTFGKESFDYDKRASKPEDFNAPQPVPQQPSQQPVQHLTQGQPQGRQLSSFSNAYFKPPLVTSSLQNFPPPPIGFRSDQTRQRQSFRPVSFPGQTNYKHFDRPNSQNSPLQQHPQFQQQPKYHQPNYQNPPFVKPSPQFNSIIPPQPQHLPPQPQHLPPQQPPLPQQFSHTISHPPPTRFQVPKPQTRQPVPYKPFETFRPNPPSPIGQPSPPHRHQTIQFRPETHFSSQQPPLPQQGPNFNVPRFSQPLSKPNFSQRIPQEIQPQQHFDNLQPTNIQHHSSQNIQNQPPLNFQNQPPIYHQQHFSQSPVAQQSLPNERPIQNFNQNNAFAHNQQPPNNQFQNVVPPGGELIHSVPKYEQHISSIEPSDNHQQQPQHHQQQPQHHQQQPQHHQQQSQHHQQQLQHQQQTQHLPQQLALQQPQQQHSFQQQHHQQLTEKHAPQQNLQHQLFQQKPFEQLNSQEQVSQEVIQQNILEQQRRILKQQQREEEIRNYYIQQQLQQQQQQQSKNEVIITSPSPSTIYQTRKTQFESTTPRYYIQSSTSPSSTVVSTTEASTPSSTTKDPKILEAQLPDEVPEELRQQLLSSGILNHADISVLDYDKEGDIPLSALPPDQLANFFNAGGGAQIAGSEQVTTVVKTDGSPVAEKLISKKNDYEPEPAASEVQEVKVNAAPSSKNVSSAVDFKVVHYDPATDNGQKIQESYMQGEQKKQINPVVLNDESYTRYLPLKVNGSQFPIPDVPELKGKKISSVVVLAPITYDFSSDRKTREASKNSDIELIQGEALKQLLDRPTSENYKKFLESENKTSSDKQAVILLVTDPSDLSHKNREIFMYDVGTQTVSKLSGELSSAFVEAAEANSEDSAQEQAAASNIVETRIPYNGKDDIDRKVVVQGDLDESASSFIDTKIPIIDPMNDEDMETDASEKLQSFVDISGHPVGDLSVAASDTSSYTVGNLRVNSKTGNS